MTSKRLKNLVEKNISESTEFWAGKPKMTLEELKAVERFAKEKAEPFGKIFNSPEKVENFKSMLEKALQEG